MPIGFQLTKNFLQITARLRFSPRVQNKEKPRTQPLSRHKVFSPTNYYHHYLPPFSQQPITDPLKPRTTKKPNRKEQMAYPLAIVLGSFLELEAPELDPSPSSAASPVMGKAATVIPGSPPPGAWPLAIAVVG